jgi:hypothetical protein
MQHVLDQLPPLFDVGLYAAVAEQLTPVAVWTLSILVHLVNAMICTLSVMASGIEWAITVYMMTIASVHGKPAGTYVGETMRAFYSFDADIAAAMAHERPTVCEFLKLMALTSRMHLAYTAGWLMRVMGTVLAINDLVLEHPTWAAIALCLCYIAYQHWAAARSSPRLTPAADEE